MPKNSSKNMKSKVEKTKTDKVKANTASSPKEGDKGKKSLLSKSKGRNKTSKSSEKVESSELNDNSTEENFQNPNDSSESPKEGVNVDDEEKGEIQEGENQNENENVGHETNDDESEEEETSEDESEHLTEYQYPMKDKMQIYGDWFPIENFLNPNPVDFQQLPEPDLTYGKPIPPFTHRFDVNWLRIRELECLFYGERFFPVFEWLRLELDATIQYQPIMGRDTPTASDWGNHIGLADSYLIFIPPHDLDEPGSPRRCREGSEIIESRLSAIRPIALTFTMKKDRNLTTYRDRVYAFSLILEVGPMEYEERNPSPLIPRHKSMPHYDDWRFGTPTIWLPSLFGELYCSEGWASDWDAKPLPGYNQTGKTSPNLSGAIIFIFGWKTEVEFLMYSHDQQLERYLSRAHWVACTDGQLFYNCWVQEFVAEMKEISRKLMNSAVEEDRWTNAFMKMFLWEVAARVREFPVHETYPVYTNDWEELLKGFPITEYDQERQDYDIIDKSLGNQAAVDAMLKVNREEAKRQQDEKKAQAYWANKMAYDDHDMQSTAPPPTLENHGLAQFQPGFYPPRKPQYEVNKTVKPPSTPLPLPPTFPDPYPFYICNRKDGGLNNTRLKTPPLPSNTVITPHNTTTTTTPILPLPTPPVIPVSHELNSGKVSVISNATHIHLPMNFNSNHVETVMKLIAKEEQMTGASFDRALFDPRTKLSIDMYWEMNPPYPYNKEETIELWSRASPIKNADLFKWLHGELLKVEGKTDGAGAGRDSNAFLKFLKEHPFKLSTRETATIINTRVDILLVYNEMSESLKTPELQASYCDVLFRGLIAAHDGGKFGADSEIVKTVIRKAKDVNRTWKDLIALMKWLISHMQALQQRVDSLGEYFESDRKRKPEERKKEFPKRGSRRNNTFVDNTRTVSDPTPSPTPPPSLNNIVDKIDCKICGKIHPAITCMHANDPKRNSSTQAWADSPSGMAMKVKGYETLVGKFAAMPLADVPQNTFIKGEILSSLFSTRNFIANIVMSISPFKETRAKQVEEVTLEDEAALEEGVGADVVVKVNALWDSGASTNFISSAIVDRLNKSKYNIKIDRNLSRINGGFSGSSTKAIGQVNFNLNFKDENTILRTFAIRATIIDSDNEVIVGQPTLYKLNLIAYVPSIFFSDLGLSELLHRQCSEGRRGGKRLERDGEAAHVRVVNKLAGGRHLHPEFHGNYTRGGINPKPVSHVTCDDTHTHGQYLNTLILERRQFLNNINPSLPIRNSNKSTKSAFERENLDDIIEKAIEAVPSEMVADPRTEKHPLPTRIEGPSELIARIRALLIEFQPVFRTTVNPIPATVEPFELLIDPTKWEVEGNSGPPRRADAEKQYALERLVRQLLDLGVIRLSRSAYYSQGFIVPKSKGEWRLVIDYRELNRCTLNAEGWPIPNIKECLARLGSKKAKYFAVMDLTSGYYQAEINKIYAKWTAFITPMGVFEWLRLPMGLKGAPSYFQRIMSTIVLKGLLYICCEVYLDDIIVYGMTEEEFLENLKKVLQRFRECNLTLNPSKCVFGVSSVEYVGHVIDSDGMTFTRERLDSVYNFIRPETLTQLRSFLGLANWFHDHIRDHSNVVRPLNQIIVQAKLQRQIVWNEDTIESFNKIREAIHNCPKLFFMDDIHQIVLATDASDYGIGGYLYQVIDGREVPIAFISKSLSEQQCGWDVPEKEGYAIYYSLKKWEYLLRDRVFTIKTDHKNLTYIRDSSNKKVVRWYRELMTFDYELEHIAGKDNPIADCLSRLVPNLLEQSTHTLNNTVTKERIPSQLWDDIKNCHQNPHKREIMEYLDSKGYIGDTHNFIAGHHGVDKTMEKLKQLGKVWVNMNEHVKRFISECPCCQKMNRIKPLIETHPFTVSTYSPMERVCIDYIERLVPTTDGKNMLVVIIDAFTRFIELIPTRGTGAEGAAEALLQYFGRYGAPKQLVSDRGSQFTSHLIEQFIKLVGVEHKLTMAYSKEENSINERANREVMDHIRDIIFHKNIVNEWHMAVPIVQRIINSTKHKSTGVSPALLVFGNGIDLDRQIFHPENSSAITLNKGKLSEWLQTRLEVQAKVFAIARENLKEKDEAHLSTGTMKKGETVFSVGDYVLAEHKASFRQGPKSKLKPFLRGPLRIVKINEDKYTLQDIVTMRCRDNHATKLRKFTHDPGSQDPLDYAVRDDQYYVVEAITKIKEDPKGSFKKKSKKGIFFWVKWKGYPEESNTWEPYTSLEANHEVWSFLSGHKEKRIRDLAAAEPIEVELRFSETEDEEEDLDEEEEL